MARTLTLPLAALLALSRVAAAQANNTTSPVVVQTVADPYAPLLVLGGVAVSSCGLGLWAGLSRSLLLKICVVVLLTATSFWLAGRTFGEEFDTLQALAVLMAIAWAILVAYSLVQRNRR